MQSALSCDTRKFLGQPYYRGLSPTPPPSSDSISGSLLGVSRKLQNLLNVSPGSTPSTPPRSVRLASPFRQEIKANKPKPKTRSRKTTPKPNNTPRVSAHKAVTPRASTPTVSRAKTPTAPPRTRKRSRNVYEDDESENEMAGVRRSRDGYTTPKRLRHFPYHMPLGLGIADFESLNDNATQQETESGSEALPQIILPSIEIEDTDTANNKTAWTAEEDEQLVDLVLEKFRLTKRDWQECARRIGKDDASVGKRWQALLGEGNIGLRRGSGQFVRGRLDGCFEQS